MGRRQLAFIVSGMALLAGGAVHAQGAVDFSKVEIKSTRLADNFHVLEGAGGAVSVLTGPDGVLVVDAQFAPLTDKLVAAIRKVSDQPIRFLINTHLHGDHTGGNENFARLGATIYGHDNIRSRLARPAPSPTGAPGTPAPAKALPLVTYRHPVTLHVNGEEVRVIPVRPAHTDGDTMIHFPKLDILVVGDYYRSVGFPRVDRVNGGTLEGLIAALGETIGLAGPNTRIIPGHGHMVGRGEVVAHRDMVLAVRDRMAPLVAQGRTVEEVLAARVTAEFDSQVPQGAETAEQFVRWMYAELKAAQ